jgi:hypothetical protein
MVELVTINEALPGDSPDYPKKKETSFSIKARTCFQDSMHLRVFLVLTILG